MIPLETLQEVPLFAVLSQEDREQLAAIATSEERDAGDVLFQEGATGEDVFVILEGRVALCMSPTHARETCFLSLRRGELLGWESLLGKPHEATARVVQPARCMRFGASSLLELCEADSTVGYAIMRAAFEEMADQLQHARVQLLDLYGPAG